MTIYEFVLFILLLIKMAVLFYWIKNKLEPSKETQDLLNYYEKIFTILMAFLMLFLFNPFVQFHVTDRETKLFLCVFAILTLAHSSL
jgi:hypothetical protein